MAAKTKRGKIKCDECGSEIIRNITLDREKNYFCGLICKGEYQKRARLLTKEQLHEMYVIQGMSAVDIGLSIGRDSKSVWNWMKDFGIQTRPRGSDDRQHFKIGHDICKGRVITDDHKEKLRQARFADGSKGLFKPNGDHVLKGRKGKDHPSWQGGSTPIRQSFYASDEWKAACVKVWHRTDAKCEKCGLDHRTIDRNKVKFHVHHIYSFTRYPDLRADENNLALLCAPCHRWVHSKANTDKEWIGK